ncbi:MAG: HEPN domain-containing protein [Cyanobium usitatum Tobar12.5m-G36]|nr:HEPN domain-containing protein [Cyanobium usitatum Tobar12.5m-G36]
MADADASRYLRIARADLLEARRMWEFSGFRGSSIGFLLQQAAEKALKAWIQVAGGDAPFTQTWVRCWICCRNWAKPLLNTRASLSSTSLRCNCVTTMNLRLSPPIGWPASIWSKTC